MAYEPYVPVVWQTGDLISAERMNHIEEGIRNEQVGPPGEPGVSPAISVENIENGHRVTITYAEGQEATFDVLNGDHGEQGAPGESGKDGKPGKDATINGVNTLEIVQGDNVTITQTKDGTLTISAKDCVTMEQVNAAIKAAIKNVEIRGTGGGLRLADFASAVNAPFDIEVLEG